MSRRLLALVAVVALIGCGRNPVMGNWVHTDQNGSLTATFKADKTFQVESGKEKPFATGKYEIDGSEVILTNDVSPKPGEPVLLSISVRATLSDNERKLTILGLPFSKK